MNLLRLVLPLLVMSACAQGETRQVGRLDAATTDADFEDTAVDADLDGHLLPDVSDFDATLEPDATAADAALEASTDATVPDASALDAATPDAALMDAMPMDATVVVDASTQDASTPADASADAGRDASVSDAAMDSAVVDANVDLCASVDCSAMAGPCATAACNPADGRCVVTPISEGGSCGSSVCQVGMCRAGRCESAPLPECTTCTGGYCTGGSCVASVSELPITGFEAGTFPTGVVHSATHWTISTTSPGEGTRSAQSGAISDSESTYFEFPIQARVTSTLAFLARTSSEVNFDWLEVSIDGTRRGRWSGTTAWTERYITLPQGTHTVRFAFTKDGTYSSGSNQVWVDRIRILPVRSILDFPDAASSMSVAGNWSFDAAVGHEAVGSASSAVTAASSNKAMLSTFTLDATKTVSFWVRVSSEPTYDKLEIRVDGALIDTLSGEVAWRLWTRSLDAGMHTIEWRYIKDASISGGSDRAWVDDIDLGQISTATNVCGP